MFAKRNVYTASGYVEEKYRLRSVAVFWVMTNKDCIMRTILSVIVRILPSCIISVLSFAGLSAIIDIDEDKEIIFGDELTIDHIVWMGTQPTLKEKSGRVGITEVMPSAEIMNYLHKAVRKGTDSALPASLQGGA